MAKITRFGIAAALAVVPQMASAQATVSTELPEENGILIGSGRLHPTFEFETRYDSHAAFDDEGVGRGDLILGIRPGVRFLAPSETLQLRFNGHYEYQAYTGMDDVAGDDFSTSDYSKSAADIDFSALFNRDGDIRFEVADRFVRSDRTSNLSLGVNSISNRNDATLRLTTLSEGAWVIEPSYVFTLEGFESLDERFDDAITAYDYNAHTVGIDTRFTVAPKTAFVVDGSVGFRSYTADEPVGEDVGNARVMAGLQGILAPKVGYKVKLGYGAQFGQDTEDRPAFGSGIGQAELGYAFTARSTVRAGYLRTFEADPFASYYQDDRIYVGADNRLGSNVGLKAGLAYDEIRFGVREGARRKDTLFTLSLAPSYDVNAWFTVGAGYAFTSRVADERFEEANSPYDYDRHEVSARLAFVY